MQRVLAARSRLVVLRLLLGEPRTFGKLREQVDLSAAGVRAALTDLAELGYVVGRLPRRPAAQGSVGALQGRDLVLGDVMALVVYLLR